MSHEFGVGRLPVTAASLGIPDPPTPPPAALMAPPTSTPPRSCTGRGKNPIRNLPPPPAWRETAAIGRSETAPRSGTPSRSAETGALCGGVGRTRFGFKDLAAPAPPTLMPDTPEAEGLIRGRGDGKGGKGKPKGRGKGRDPSVGERRSRSHGFR